MATNDPMPKPVFVTVHAHFMGSTITTAMHFRLNAADHDEAVKVSAERCIPGFVVTGTRPATRDDKQPWLN